MRLTKNKTQVLEALAYIDPEQVTYPPYNAARVKELLKDPLGYGEFDLANLTRTLKALVAQGLVRCSVGPIDMSGQNGFVERWFEQQRMKYWPANLDLEAMRIDYKITQEDQDLKFHNFFQRRYCLPELTMDEFREYRQTRDAAMP